VKLQESAGVSFSLSFLIQLMVGLTLLGYGYSTLEQRISLLTNNSASYAEAIARIEETMRSSQDAPISADYTQNSQLASHSSQILEVKSRLQLLETRIYELIALE
tara:strand:+ start:637 stop:951 length:315 start_codon:yes stop_codon:yes gene_type:complete